MESQVLEELFIKDGYFDQNTNKIRFSTYLQIKRDLKNLLIDSKDNLGLSILVDLMLICSCIDLFSKISEQKKPNPGENAKFFKKYLEETCDFKPEEAKALWELRNGIMHSFTLSNNQGVILFGTEKPVQIGKRSTSVTFNVRRLHTKILFDSAKDLHKKLLNVENRATLEQFIINNGFFYKKCNNE